MCPRSTESVSMGIEVLIVISSTCHEEFVYDSKILMV
jgi:hypothetical protein